MAARGCRGLRVGDLRDGLAAPSAPPRCAIRPRCRVCGRALFTASDAVLA
jgi:hypothetical protein